MYKIIFDNITYLGYEVPKLCKLVMYDFHNHKFHLYYGINLMLHYMDTDPNILSLKNDDLTRGQL